MFRTAFLCLLCMPATAQPLISGAWARATAPGQDDGVAYFTITVQASDRLVGVSTPEADMAMLHATSEAGGRSTMTDVDSVALPAGRAVAFSPHGMHVMLMGLKHPLRAGARIGLDLRLAKAGAVHADVPVQPIGAEGPPR